VITLDLLDNKLILIDSSAELKPSHKSQLIFWRFIKSRDGNSYEILFDPESIDDQTFALKLIEFLKEEEVEYTPSLSLEELLTCKFRLKAATHSDSFRPLIPEQSGHPFRLIPAIFCAAPESCLREAALDNLKGKSHHVPSEKGRRTRWPERGYPCEKSKRC
jgi:hypothetical protein